MEKKTALGILAPLALAAGTVGASEKLYQFAFKRVDKVPETSADKQKYAQAYFDYVKWLNDQKTYTWKLNQTVDDKHLNATYLPAKNKTNRSVIIAHGYKGNGETMANYAKMFHQLGFNVLLPDDRGHGQSAGKYISFGWLDRLDYLKWIKLLITRLGVDSQIVLFGVSMGGATVEMLSGEKLPDQVKCLIADCGYSDIIDELSYLLKRTFHLPKYPFVSTVSLLNQYRQGFQLRQASSVDQLKKNHLPIFFIHGQEDVYVPVGMIEENYQATQGPKEKWIVPTATHAESFWVNPKEYQRRIAAFTNKYTS